MIPPTPPDDTVDLCALGQPFQVRGDAEVVGRVRTLLDCFADREPGPDRRRTVVSVRRRTAGHRAGHQTRRGPGHGSGSGCGSGHGWYGYEVTSTSNGAGTGGIGTGGTDEPVTTWAAGPQGAAVLVLAAVNAVALAGANCMAVHAGVVSREGRAVAFPAGSGHGKSTLTASCLRAGMDYVSDEALCLDWRGGQVLPYPRPLELSGWSRAVVGLRPGPDDELVTAADLGATLARPPLVLEHVVLPCRQADAGRSAVDSAVELEPLPLQRAAAALLTRSFNHWRDPDRAFELAHAVAARTRVWRLRLGDPVRAAALLWDLLGPDPARP